MGVRLVPPAPPPPPAPQPPPPKVGPTECSEFEVLSGDIPGSDLDHVMATEQAECCEACLNRGEDCEGFAFSRSRTHCWLKTFGADRIDTDSDMMVGLRIRGKPS